MIGPSDLYRIPASSSAYRSEGIARYARLELGAETIAWTSSPSSPRAPRASGLRQWLASHLRLARPTPAQASAAPLRAGLAAVHFDDEAFPRAARPVSAEIADHPCDVLASSALILPVQPRQPNPDEACTCEP